MDWGELLLYVLEAVASLLITVLGSVLIPLLINKYTTGKTNEMLTELNRIVTDAVKEVYQTYVEALKGTDGWTKEAQESALNKALAIVKANESPKLADWLNKHQSDAEAYIVSLIETAIYNLKK